MHHKRDDCNRKVIAPPVPRIAFTPAALVSKMLLSFVLSPSGPGNTAV